MEMDYSELFHSFLNSLVIKESPLEIENLILYLQHLKEKNEIYSNLKQEFIDKLQDKSCCKLKIQDYVKNLDSHLKELEGNIIKSKSEPLDLDVLLEFARSLSKTSHPFNNSEAPIPQDSKILYSLLFNQTSLQSLQEEETKKEEMDWITTSLSMASDTSLKKENDLSLLDLDL